MADSDMPGISQTPEISKDSTSSLPCWMEAIKKSLEDDDNPRNARLFILKLILNCESFFRPYAKFWFTPIMKALQNRCAGSSMNYMFTDIVTMLLEWHDVAIPNSDDIEKRLASEILNFFMSNVESNRRDVFKHNIDIVKTIVELWKSCLDIPYQLLVDKINVRGDAESANTEVGLQLVAVMLANGIEPWNAVGKMLFLNNLVSNFESNKSEVYLPCAEVVGMTLKMLGAGESTEMNTDAAVFLQRVEEKLMKMKAKASNSSLTKFLLCLCSIGKHCSFVVKQFATVLCFQVQRLSGSLQAKCLEMISLWPEAVLELVATGVGNFLRSHNMDVQEAALIAVSQVTQQLNTLQLVSLMPDIVQFVSHASVTCRCKMFDILIWVHDKYNNDPSPQGRQLFEESRTTLIRGLVDADATIQDLIYNTWCKSAVHAGCQAALSWVTHVSVALVESSQLRDAGQIQATSAGSLKIGCSGLSELRRGELKICPESKTVAPFMLIQAAARYLLAGIFDGEGWSLSRGNANSKLTGATVAEQLACSPPTKAIRFQSPAGSLWIFTCWNCARRCRRLVGFFGELPFPPTLSFQHCSILTLIGSQDLNVKSHPNPFTHSLTTHMQNYVFWNNSTRLPASTSQRLLTLIKNLYSPTTEHLLTGFLAHLQLQASVLSPDYNTKVFDHPLGACRFEEYPMLVSWHAQHTMMAPLFANTLASQLRSPDPESFDMIVRATQESLAFKPTCLEECFVLHDAIIRKCSDAITAALCEALVLERQWHKYPYLIRVQLAAWAVAPYIQVTCIAAVRPKLANASFRAPSATRRSQKCNSFARKVLACSVTSCLPLLFAHLRGP
ncbi:hypothetical protein PR048_030450 [Dryococelus australis]|uniref:Uncharacterized protein n=1 Tax=Dryococelus australis TaxID=614101 RepID=A0ABQ9G906_9NEOP|nr:hypothetical protein PR048_030450 [Dryococelus australis]